MLNFTVLTILFILFSLTRSVDPLRRLTGFTIMEVFFRNGDPVTETDWIKLSLLTIEACARFYVQLDDYV